MKIDKAIEIVTDLTYYSYTGNPQDELDALKLLIEAGKRLNELRTPSSGDPHLPLPGETKE